MTSKGEMLKFLTFLEDVWNSHYGSFKLTGKKVLKLRLATGGWSGNEDIVCSLQDTNENMFWACFWEKSKRGGLYIFRINIDYFYKEHKLKGV
jgi:hypothetical protein